MKESSDDPFVCEAEDGEVAVLLSGVGGFRKKPGEPWRRGSVSAVEAMERFAFVKDPKRATTLIQAASAAASSLQPMRVMARR